MPPNWPGSLKLLKQCFNFKNFHHFQLLMFLKGPRKREAVACNFSVESSKMFLCEVDYV